MFLDNLQEESETHQRELTKAMSIRGNRHDGLVQHVWMAMVNRDPVAARWSPLLQQHWDRLAQRTPVHGNTHQLVDGVNVANPV